MDLEEEIVRASKRMIDQKIERAKAERQALLDKCIKSAINIIERNKEYFKQEGITAVGNYIAGGYEAKFSGDSINGSINILDINSDPATVKAYDRLTIFVNCRAHSCLTQSSYEGDIPESDIIDFVKYATRKPTLTDRWRRMTREYQGEI